MRNMEEEEEEFVEEHMMADGSMVKTQGRVLVKFHCGGCKGSICARLFLQTNKAMILGICGFQRRTPTLTRRMVQWLSSKDADGFHYHSQNNNKMTQTIIQIFSM